MSKPRWFVALFGLAPLAVGCGGSGGGVGGPLDASVAPTSYHHRYKCNQVGPAPMNTWCADPNGAEQIAFVRVDAGVYEVHQVPDDPTRVATGSFAGQVFTWTYPSPSGYEETGSYTFSADFRTFTGTSSYIATDLSYTGSCTATGTVSPGTAAAPTAIGACP